MMVRRAHGIAIVMVLLAVALVAVIALGLTTMAGGNLMHVASETESLNALYAAQGGAWTKKAQIEVGDAADIVGATTAVSQAIYDVEVFQGGETASNGFVVPGGAGTYYILATGTSRRGTERRVALLGTMTSTTFDHAAFGATKVSVKDGSTTEAYSSTDPAFNDHSRATVATGSTTSNGLIDFGGDTSNKVGGSSAVARIFGPPGSTEGAVVSGGNQPDNYVGFGTYSQARDLDPVTIPDSSKGIPDVGTTDVVYDDGLVHIISPGSYKKLELKSGTTVQLDLSSVGGGDGIFVFESVILNESSNIEILVPGFNTAGVDIGDRAHLYCKSDFKILSGSVVNPTATPSRMQFFIENGVVSLKDEGTAYYVAFAPTSKVVLTDASTLYGSVIADEVELLNGSKLVYDVDLQTLGGGSPKLTVWSVHTF